jgi:hypothetical protein
MTSILVTIETDAEAALKWARAEASAGLAAVAGLVMPIIRAAAPTLIADVKAGVEAVLGDVGRIGSIDDLEQDFIERLEATGSTLLSAVETLEGPILQAVIALVKAA